MRCPYCKSDNDRVIDSRASADGFAIRRRRSCRDCGRRYTTYERVENAPLRVVKKNGERVEIDRQKIMAGLLRACEKRPVSSSQLEAVVDYVERQCMEAFDKEVPSKVIGELIMQELRQLDQVAYVRFASVYREFRDVSQFLEELKPLLEKPLPEKPLPEKPVHEKPVHEKPVHEKRGSAGKPAPAQQKPGGPPRGSGRDGRGVDRRVGGNHEETG